jgi:hypothetical protein
MVAGPRNGFAQVVFDQNAATCTEKPYAFHPMYSTSSEDTRVMWAAHSYNVAFSDEIGHFEYCPKVDHFAGSCVSPATASDPGGTDADDQDGNCAPANDSTLVQIDGCTGSDGDFDGPAYQATWPGTGTPAVDRARKPTWPPSRLPATPAPAPAAPTHRPEPPSIPSSRPHAQRPESRRMRLAVRGVPRSPEPPTTSTATRPPSSAPLPSRSTIRARPGRSSASRTSERSSPTTPVAQGITRGRARDEEPARRHRRAAPALG